MAWLEQRNQGGEQRWRVVWRQDGAKQQQTFPNAAEAEDFLGHVKAAHDRWPHGWVKGRGWAHESGSDVPTFREYATRTVTHRARADERTRDDYLAMLERHVYPVIGALPLDRIDRFHVASVAEAMRGDGRKPKTIANVHSLLSSVLTDAVRDELIRRNVAVGALPAVRPSDDEVAFLTAGEVDTIAQRIPEGVYRDLVRFLYGTGLRWSEATALRVSDVDLLGLRALHVRQAWKRRGGRFEVGPPKTRRSRRTVTLSPALVDLLAPYMTGDGLVFTTTRGRPIRHSNFYSRLWVPAVAAACRCDTHRAAPDPCGCPGTLTRQPGIHSLRHSHASHLIAEKASILAVSRRLGHESIQTTMNTYGHLMPEYNDEIDAAVDLALSPR
jgi:integrase